MRYLTPDDARAAVLGGLVFGAGGGGLESGLQAVDAVFKFGQPRLATLDDFNDDDLTIVTTGVGAPGSKAGVVFPRDNVRAIELVRSEIRTGTISRNPRGEVVGTIDGHPGAWMPMAWLPAVLDETLAVIDCSTNGRGHPSVRMGGFGITGDLSHRVIMAAVGGLDDADGHIELVLSSGLAPGSDLLRKAADLLGGSIAASRGPFSIGFLREAGAIGTVSACIRLGEAMRAAQGGTGDAMIDAVVSTLGGRVATQGRITSNSIELQGAYDVGYIEIDGGDPIRIGVVNEYLTLDIASERVSTFPDLIVLLDAATGMPVSASPAAVGAEVVVVVVDRSLIPLGRGVWDHAAYTGVQRLLDTNLTDYL